MKTKRAAGKQTKNNGVVALVLRQFGNGTIEVVTDGGATWFLRPEWQENDVPVEAGRRVEFWPKSAIDSVELQTERFGFIAFP